MNGRWWIDEDWYYQGMHMITLICCKGWKYSVYIAQVLGDKYKIIEDVTGNKPLSANEILEIYDLCRDVDSAKIIKSASLCC